LVPGILPEKLQQLLKRLPKNLRRRLVPLPDAVDCIMDELVIGKGSLYQELEHVLSRRYHMSIQRSDWQADLLPAHLRMRFQLVDDQDFVKTTSRVFDDLLACERQATTGVTIHSQSSLPPVRAITPADLDTIDRKIPVYDVAGRIIGLYFPALKVNEGAKTVQVHFIDDETKSKQMNRLGLQFLYGLEINATMSAIRSLCKTSITSHSASWLSLGAKSTASDLRAALQAFLFDELFATRSGELPSCAQFQKTLAAVTAQGVLRTATSLLEKIQDILRQRRLVLNRINEWATRTKASKNYQPDQHAEYAAALEQIVPVQFLQTLNAEQLQHKPRYLQALALRIERAEHSPLKDKKKAEQLLTPVARVRQMTHFNNPTIACLNCQQEYLELLEEFRVSLFAPELGTAKPVSEKRLLQKWKEVENICRRVE
jgi:ATP-dependent helicase HrpA